MVGVRSTQCPRYCASRVAPSGQSPVPRIARANDFDQRAICTDTRFVSERNGRADLVPREVDRGHACCRHLTAWPIRRLEQAGARAFAGRCQRGRKGSGRAAGNDDVAGYGQLVGYLAFGYLIGAAGREQERRYESLWSHEVSALQRVRHR